MRVSGALILVVLISMAVVVFLQSRDISSKQDALAIIATELREEGVDGVAFDRQRATEIIGLLERLIAEPDQIDGRTDDLKTISATAAGWAAGASSPSAELEVSVALRKAAGELRTYAVRPSATSLDRARYQLGRARTALSSEPGGAGTTETSGLVTDGVRDRIQNLEMSQKEKALELEEEIGP
jgi:hypothetical protein